MKKIIIINYGCGNILSIQRALKEIGYQSSLSNNNDEIMSADFVILPGVGAFENAIKLLNKYKLIQTIKNYVALKKPLLGICLGMQILFSTGFEMGSHTGLNFIKGKVDKINKDPNNKKIKIPHINWSNLYFIDENSKFNFNQNLNGRSFYFVHSYMAFPENKNDLIAYCKYFNINIPAIIKSRNVIGFQFHPEKSGKNGLEVLKNTIEGAYG